MMISVAQFLESYRHLIYYIISISVLRGLIVPDFRFGYISVLIIQFVYPVLLLIPLLVWKWAHPEYWGYLLLGVIGIALSLTVSVTRYGLEFGWDALDAVSSAVTIISFAGMTILFAVVLALALAYWRH